MCIKKIDNVDKLLVELSKRNKGLKLVKLRDKETLQQISKKFRKSHGHTLKTYNPITQKPK